MIKNISLYLVIAYILSFSSEKLQSDFLATFLSSNLINILITLLAINTATASILLSKLKEISEKHNSFNFNETYSELKKSLFEQIVLIILAIVIGIFSSSQIIKEHIENHQLIMTTANTFVFIYSIDILRDTGIAIFSIINFENKNK
jgi:hypothetical protein